VGWFAKPEAPLIGIRPTGEAAQDKYRTIDTIGVNHWHTRTRYAWNCSRRTV